MRISDWSSDVCSSDLASARRVADVLAELGAPGVLIDLLALLHDVFERRRINGRAIGVRAHHEFPGFVTDRIASRGIERPIVGAEKRSEEHTSELQSLMRISYAGFCLTTNKIPTPIT